LVPLVLLPLVAGPGSAGIIFGKKKKPVVPAERVPELFVIVKTNGDESKRAAAAQELRQYDPTQFPNIVPILIDVLQNDKKPSVRAEAAQSLGKLRPISQQVGMALEQARANDSSMRVRLQAKSSLMQYHWGGYRNSGKKDEVGPKQTKEPPLADEKMPPVISTTNGSSSPSHLPPSNPPAPFPLPTRPTSKEPPLAPVSRPVPVRPQTPPNTPPANEGGPDLSPPQ
jgi:hypothetical protein